MKKKIVISLCMVMAATAVLTSCKKDNDTVSFRATISTYQNNGKVYIDNNRYANWIDGDKVLINGTTYTVGVEGSGDSRIASINGVTAVTSGGYYAIYPSECALTTSTSTSGFPEILLPQVQLYRNDNPANPAQGNQIVEAPMAAYCPADRHGLDFTNLCSLLKITLPYAMEVGYITVSSSKPLWGRASISINSTTNLPTISSPERASLYSTDNTVTLDCTALGLHHEGSGASSGVTSAGPFYIVLPPATDVQGLTVNVYVFTGNASGQTRRTILKYAKTRSNPITIASNNLYVTGDLPDQGVEVPDVPFPHLSIGEFSVSRTKKVRFALGNLQYQASTGTWRFAENQWDFVGNGTNGIDGSNASISSSYSKWIDLFGYGTSGVAHNSNTYYPYTHTTNNSNYASVTIGNTNHDWGVNIISNGGNQPNKWRTLTRTELSYLFNTRSNNQQLHYANCIVHGVKGMIILPDNFPYNESPYNNSNWQWESLNNDQWAQAEALGAVFMPVTGRRSGASISGLTNNRNDVGKGYYWTSQYYSSWDQAYCLEFDSGDNFHSDNAYLGMAVRLARDVN